ncbi:MAG: hypothetical protein IJ087_20530 [Eggerthellaceae bacterium]|nr:hypothetical protein [Eggerthellaceae bacterium]
MFESLATNLIVARDLIGLERLFNERLFARAFDYNVGLSLEMAYTGIDGVDLDHALSELGLRVQLTYSQSGIGSFSDYGLWQAFSSDYHAFEEKAMFEQRENDWLLNENGTSASLEDKEFFLGAYKAMRLPLSYVEACPPDVFDRWDVIVHAWNDATAHVIDFECVDDGGLSSCHQPLGETFLLVDSRGIHAQVTITEDRRGSDLSGMDRLDQCRGVAPLAAEGWIEGYTAQGVRSKPKMTIRLGASGKPHMLGYLTSGDDYPAINSSPLWKGYRIWCAEKSARVQSEWKPLLAQYLHKLYASEVIYDGLIGKVSKIALNDDAPISVTVDFGDSERSFGYPDEFAANCDIDSSPYDGWETWA